MFLKWQNVASWWQNYAALQNIVVKMSFPYKAAYLSKPNDNSLEKKWFITFWVWNETKGELERKRIIAIGDSVEEREKFANSLISEINAKLEKGIVVAPVKRATVLEIELKPNMLLTDALLFFTTLKTATLKKKSSTTYSDNSKNFEEFLTKKGLLGIKLNEYTAAQASEYTDYIILEKKLSNKSHNKLKGFASSVFNEFVRRKLIQENPFSNIPGLIVTQGGHRVFTPAQIAEFKNIVHQHQPGMWFFAAFIYYTFMRPHQEARQIKVGDIGDKTIRVQETIAKTSVIRHVYIPPGLEALLQQHEIRSYPSHFYLFSYNAVPGAQLVSEGYWYKKHKKVLIQMGLFNKGYDLYGWKHTGVCALYRATKDIKLVQEQCGHKDIKQTVDYLRDLGVLFYEGQINKFPTI